MFWVGFAAGFILGGVMGIVVFALAFGTRREGEADAEADHQRRQTGAIAADQERADDIEQRAEAARRAVAGDGQKLAGDRAALAERLRRSGRGRTPGV